MKRTLALGLALLLAVLAACSDPQNPPSTARPDSESIGLTDPSVTSTPGGESTPPSTDPSAFPEVDLTLSESLTPPEIALLQSEPNGMITGIGVLGNEQTGLFLDIDFAAGEVAPRTYRVFGVESDPSHAPTWALVRTPEVADVNSYYILLHVDSGYILTLHDGEYYAQRVDLTSPGDARVFRLMATYFNTCAFTAAIDLKQGLEHRLCMDDGGIPYLGCFRSECVDGCDYPTVIDENRSHDDWSIN